MVFEHALAGAGSSREFAQAEGVGQVCLPHDSAIETKIRSATLLEEDLGRLRLRSPYRRGTRGLSRWRSGL